MEKVKNSDRVFEDMLDDDFVKVLQVGFRWQRLFGMLGVQLKYKFITPPTMLYKMYSVAFWLVNLACIIHTVMYCSTIFDPLSTDIPLKIGIVINSITNAGLAWKSSFCSGHSKSQLYVKLQRIERTLKMKNAKLLNKRVYMTSSLWAVLIIPLYSLWLIPFNKYLMKGFCPSVSISSIASSSSFIPIFHIYTILKLIMLRVQYVIEALTLVGGTQQKHVYSTAKAGTTAQAKIGEELVSGMYCILDSFADTMDVFQHVIFFFSVQVMTWLLITMQNFVITFKNQISLNILSFLCTCPGTIVFLALILTICLISQALHNRLEACGELCTGIISSLDGGESRDNAKRIAVMLKGRRQATVFDIFTLNTSLPFHLLGITATYTIVLLQIATI